MLRLRSLLSIQRGDIAAPLNCNCLFTAAVLLVGEMKSLVAENVTLITQRNFGWGSRGAHDPWPSHAVEFFAFQMVSSNSGKWTVEIFFRLKDLVSYHYILIPLTSFVEAEDFYNGHQYWVSPDGIKGSLGLWFNRWGKQTVQHKFTTDELFAWLLAN
jgi:hypothetical protein